MTIFYFIIGLGLLIFVHELGHFLFAKFSGIRVERFSLGFGPHIGKKIGETEYCISALPLGGYVKMSGQEDFEEGEIVPLDDPRAFSSKSIWIRLGVVLAGPGMNLVLPFLLMPLVFMVGRQEPKYLRQAPVVLGVQEQSPAEKSGLQKGDVLQSINGKPVAHWREVLNQMSSPGGTVLQLEIQRQGQTLKKELTLSVGKEGVGNFSGIEPTLFYDVDPIIGGFGENSPAKAAGMKEEDWVVAVSHQPIRDWNQMSERVNASGGKPLVFTVKRKSGELDLTITPMLNESSPWLQLTYALNAPKRYLIGVAKGMNPEHYEKIRYGFVEAIEKGIHENMVLFGMTFRVLKDLVTLKASVKELGGPIRIAEISAKAAEQGVGNFLFLLAFLSIQLGVLNLLPVPVLDGGHVAFMVYEGVARKPLSMKKRLIAQQVGMVLLLTLMVFVTFNDINSVWGFKQIFESVKGWF